MEADRYRPDPDLLLQELKSESESGKTAGRMKVFFGYAAGVGKTYAMLEAAQRAKEAGIDVVAGYIEPHSRPETMELLHGLETLPTLQVRYKGIALREFDLDGALKRHPQLILVDELAHTNAEGCRHRKRYQDIEELLRAGIDVYTTVNVQHIESLNDIVSSITGVVVGERVPDWVFDSATQVELVDIEPDDLIVRLEQGKIYREQQARKALTNFFSRENLVALREIALRRTADRLNRAAMTPDGGRGAPAAGEHILICLSSAPSNAKVIRTAARMAEAFHSSFTALFVETPGTPELSGENRRRLRANLKLAEDLGARIATVYGDDVPGQIAEYAKASGVSKIIIGRSNNKKRLFLSGSNLIDRLTALAPNLDIYIIPDAQPYYAARRRWLSRQFQFSWTDLAKAIGMVALSTIVSGLFYAAGFSEANIITVYILGVLFASVITDGWIYGALVSFVSVLAFNYFFTDPYFTLRAYDASYPVTFLVMFASSLVTSTLTMRVKNQARQAARKAYRTEVLLQTSQKLQQAESADDILTGTARQMVKLLGCSVFFYPVQDGNLMPALCYPLTDETDIRPCLIEEERGVAQWVLKNNKHAGATTNTLPSAKCLYMAVRGQKEVFAVAGIAVGEQGIDSFEENLLIAMLGECGLALEKVALGAEKRKAQMQAQQEQLRANLLRAISHDLRTPLTSISGNAGILMGNSAILDEDKKMALYTDIYDDSMWLINLVENLLSVTRIENGSMSIHMAPELLDEVFREALRHLGRKAGEHEITVDLKDDMLMAQMDARLIIQVIINIVDNAIKYTPPGSRIALRAKRMGKMAMVEIADDGPGIADDAKGKLFDMFYTAGDRRADGRRGLGLGLSLCKSIVQSHGGEIGVRDNNPKGTIFYFTLQSAEVNPIE